MPIGSVATTSAPFTSSGGDWSGNPAPVGAAAVAIAFARAQIGKPYVWGATGPNAYDCSGLVQAAFRQAGVNLPRVTQQMILSGVAVDRANLQPGDLVFPDLGHVQIFTGGGMVVEAPRTGLRVREVPLWGVWRARRVVGGRVVAPGPAWTSSGGNWS